MAPANGIVMGRWPWLDHLLVGNERINLVKNIVVFIVAVRLLGRIAGPLRDRGLLGVLNLIRLDLTRRFFRAVKRIPFVQRKIDQEIGKILVKVEHEVAPKWEDVPRYTALPKRGLTEEELNRELDKLETFNLPTIYEGKVSGSVYHGGKDMVRIPFNACQRFALSNPLHPDQFPGVRKMDAEVVAMVVNMFNGGTDACGTTTSGGTESILMACKTMRDWARDVKGITEPEMVIPVSAHAAFDKAGHYFGIRVLHAPCETESRRVDVRALSRMITRNTIMASGLRQKTVLRHQKGRSLELVKIVGSAPSFPHGAVDDIQALGKLARKHNIGLHVDCCLGGFIVPFMEKAGFHIAPVDFRVPGVTSISCDTHKYGFAPKGSSVIMYSSKALRRYQYMTQTDWPGGIYASPAMAGSRPGALLAGCWAALVHMGEDGYIETTRQIVATTRFMAEQCRQIPGIVVFGNPEVCALAIGSKVFDILLLGAEMTKRGWNLNSLQYPASIHISVTYLTVKAKDEFVKDVREIAATLMENPKAGDAEAAAIYGLAAAIPDRSLVDDIARGFVDALYSA